MPTTIFDWIARTAMLAMAGLVTLSILAAIATMAGDPDARFAGGDRAANESERAEGREAARASPTTGEGNAAAAASSAESREATAAAARPAPEDKVARWLEAIAFALLALAGIGALGVLMLWSILRELRRIGRSKA